MEEHEYEILSAMSKQDWLHVYSKAIKDHKLDMDQFARTARTPELYDDDI